MQKVAAFFASMKTFVAALRNSGHHVLHLTPWMRLRVSEDLQNLIAHTMSTFSAKQFNYQRPDEYRLLMDMRSMSGQMDFGSSGVIDTHLLPTIRLRVILLVERLIEWKLYRKMRKSSIS